MSRQPPSTATQVMIVVTIVVLLGAALAAMIPVGEGGGHSGPGPTIGAPGGPRGPDMFWSISAILAVVLVIAAIRRRRAPLWACRHCGFEFPGAPDGDPCPSCGSAEGRL